VGCANRSTHIRQPFVFFLRAALLSAAVSLCPLLAHAVTIDLVAVGNPGNSADGEGGPGAVASSYSISKYEITIGQYVEFLNAVAVTDANGQPTTGAQTAGTTEDGAYLIGATVTRRTTNPNTGAAPTYALPTSDQWYKAAYYDPTLNSGTGGYYAYATQSNTSPGNTVGPDPNQANVVVGGEYSLTQSSELVGAQNYLTDVGSYSGSSSFYGTFDQTGNTSEWTETLGDSASEALLRGGAWNLVASGAGSGISLQITTANYDTGFRLVAAVPEPGTMGLLASGVGVGLWHLARRRRGGRQAV
jgi:sulfatase modifying factor 1